MAVTREQVVDYLSALSPDRLHDLILELEDVWGIERPAGSIWPRVTMGAPLWPPHEFEQTEWDVVLVEVGADRIAVIKLVREILHLPLVEARAVVDSTPVPIREALSRERANELRERLTAAGATVEVR